AGAAAMKASVFAPGSVGNVGPGFDVLGLAAGGLGDTVTVELGRPGFSPAVIVRGVDAELIPIDPAKNAAVIAANAMLAGLKPGLPVQVTIEKGLPVSGGIGGSASSSVAGAYAAALACGVTPSHEDIILAALKGEEAVSGRHLDNI